MQYLGGRALEAFANRLTVAIYDIRITDLVPSLFLKFPIVPVLIRCNNSANIVIGKYRRDIQARQGLLKEVSL